LGVVRTRGIHPGDPVLVNRRGRFFYARVRGPGPTGGLDLDPPDERAGSHSATARELVDHWSHARDARRWRGGRPVLARRPDALSDPVAGAVAALGRPDG
jgi:hypothetical protein